MDDTPSQAPGGLHTRGFVRGYPYEVAYRDTTADTQTLVEREQQALPSWLDGTHLPEQERPVLLSRPGDVVVPHLADAVVLGANGWLFSARGSRHVQDGKPCQDAARMELGHHHDTPYMLLSVADGHGSHKHSDLGALHATIAAREALSLLLDPELDEAQRLECGGRLLSESFGRRVQSRWRATVGAPHEHGTTLLWALATPALIAVGQLGDGECWHMRPGEPPRRLFEPEGGLISTTTRSLSQDDSLFHWRFGLWPRSSAAEGIWLMTDGLSDALADPAVMLSKLGESMESPEALQQWWARGRLHERIVGWARSGSGDDVTVALLQTQALEQPATLPAPAPPLQSQEDASSPAQAELSGVEALAGETSDSPAAPDEPAMPRQDAAPADELATHAEAPLQSGERDAPSPSSDATQPAAHEPDVPEEAEQDEPDTIPIDPNLMEEE